MDKFLDKFKDRGIVYIEWERDLNGGFIMRGVTESGETISQVFYDEDFNPKIEFKDEIFEKLVRSIIKKPYGKIRQKDVQELKELDVAYEIICDFSGLEYFKGLTKLGLFGIRVDDHLLKIINSLTNIRELDLGMTYLKYINKDTFPNLINLRELVIEDNPELSYISEDAFRDNPHLENILMDETALDNLNFIKSLENLRMVVASNCRIRDISGIEYTKNIEWLRLDSNYIRDLSPLRGLSKLEHLSLNYNPIQDISSLSELYSLKDLRLKWTLISDISYLKELKNIETLYLDNNYISDIEPLRGLNKLRQITLKNNKIKSVSPIKHLNSLRVLHLENNFISDLEVLAGLYGNLSNIDF